MTFGEARTDAQKENDALVLERVRRGIALLKEEFGDDFVDHIDMETFNIRDGRFCVLGQVYADADVPYSAAAAVERAGVALARYAMEGDGYFRGIALIDGDLLTESGRCGHGFEADDVDGDEWKDLQLAWSRELRDLKEARA